MAIHDGVLFLNRSDFLQRNELGFHRHESIAKDGLPEFVEKVLGIVALTGRPLV